ncbi:hypothetical protein BDZ45DRAFT_687218 [Acephala macrosclerotiorum]|nr:hypothetical protein BDZ45DRAFT_687218 [Acephala macrosclerotiorum]
MGDDRSYQDRAERTGTSRTPGNSSLRVPSGAAFPSEVNDNDIDQDHLDLPGIYHFTSYAAFSNTNSIRKWSCSPRLEVVIGLGSGQNASPFLVTESQFKQTCRNMEFSEPFLQKIVAKASMFEHQWVFSGAAITKNEPSHLEIGMSVFENDSFFCLLRYDVVEGVAKCILFLKSMDYLKNKVLESEDMVRWLESKRSILCRWPLLIANAILEFMQLRAHEYLRWRLELYNMESRLGVTPNGQLLLMRGYEDVSYDFGLLNADLAGIAKQIADTELSSSTMMEQAKSLQRLVKICETCKADSDPSQNHPRTLSEQDEEIQATITRAELYLKHKKMAQDVLQSLTAVLYNRINKQDTNAMKTIAVVTLVFLPATFVSAVFSTGIFNFHASEALGHPKTVSKYGWVYLLVCILSTTLTILSWVCWYKWGRHWLEKLEFSRMQRSSVEPAYLKQPSAITPPDQDLALAASSNSMPRLCDSPVDLEQASSMIPPPKDIYPISMNSNAGPWPLPVVPVDNEQASTVGRPRGDIYPISINSNVFSGEITTNGPPTTQPTNIFRAPAPGVPDRTKHGYNPIDSAYGS